jgi:hypothetical protein
MDHVVNLGLGIKFTKGELYVKLPDFSWGAIKRWETIFKSSQTLRESASYTACCIIFKRAYPHHMWYQAK